MVNEPARRDHYRASDADRDVVAEDLRDALAEGRLDVHEYQRRLDAVWEAHTYGELDKVISDLPQPVERERVAAEQARKKKERREYLGAWQAWVAGSIIMTTIWGIMNFAAGQLTDFWPLWPIGVWAACLAGMALWPGDEKKG